MPDSILTSSVRARGLLEGEFGVKSEIIRPLPDCVDINRFEPASFTPEDKKKLRHDLGIPDGRPVVAYLGLLADYQGIPHLIEAARPLKESGMNLHFLIMGYPRVDYYKRMAESAGVGDRITFTGKVYYRDAPRYLSLGDLAISAKSSSTEGSGKVLNYMAMALPVVAYDTPVHREYLGKLGVYAPVGDVAALAMSMRNLVNDPDRRQALGTGLRERAAERYSWKSTGQIIEKVYLAALEDKAK